MKKQRSNLVYSTASGRIKTSTGAEPVVDSGDGVVRIQRARRQDGMRHFGITCCSVKTDM